MCTGVFEVIREGLSNLLADGLEQCQQTSPAPHFLPVSGQASDVDHSDQRILDTGRPGSRRSNRSTQMEVQMTKSDSHGHGWQHLVIVHQQPEATSKTLDFDSNS